MRGRLIICFFLIAVVLTITSCSKDPFSSDGTYYFNAPHQGDEKKVDLKGSLMNGDMKHPNIAAWLSENTLYLQFNESVENCVILVSTAGGRVVYSRQVEKQYPSCVRVYMGNKPSGSYLIHITNGDEEVEGWFYLRNEERDFKDSKNKD